MNVLWLHRNSPCTWAEQLVNLLRGEQSDEGLQCNDTDDEEEKRPHEGRDQETLVIVVVVVVVVPAATAIAIAYLNLTYPQPCEQAASLNYLGLMTCSALLSTTYTALCCCRERERERESIVGV